MIGELGHDLFTILCGLEEHSLTLSSSVAGAAARNALHDLTYVLRTIINVPDRVDRFSFVRRCWPGAAAQLYFHRSLSDFLLLRLASFFRNAGRCTNVCSSMLYTFAIQS